MQHKMYVFLFDGFADWEISYLTPELNKSDRFDLVFFSADNQLVTSMGGLRIQPTTSLQDLNPGEIHTLVLPGGAAWEKGEINGMESLTKKVFEAGKPIAAICAATTYLGKLGLLNHLKHTSNDLNYLKEMAPEYTGSEYYQNQFAVTDQNIITANGIAPIEFSKEIFKAIRLYDDDYTERWFQLFKNGIWQGQPG